VAIVITVVCEGLDHRLEFRDDGEIVMLDHSEKLVRSFVAFGAKPPECMEEIDKARKNPIEFLVKHSGIDWKVLAYLACDLAEHVLPIWYKYYPYDDRPENAIQAARKYLEGKINKATLERAKLMVWSATLEAELAARASAAQSARAVWEAVSAEGPWVYVADARAAARAAEAAAAEAAYRYAESRGNDPDEAKAAEKKWQVARAVQVLEAVSRGEDPW
jgi:hypothetical protein